MEKAKQSPQPEVETGKKAIKPDRRRLKIKAGLRAGDFLWE